MGMHIGYADIRSPCGYDSIVQYSIMIAKGNIIVIIVKCYSIYTKGFGSIIAIGRLYKILDGSFNDIIMMEISRDQFRYKRVYVSKQKIVRSFLP